MLFLLRLGEISLKGKNRKYFEKTLVKNLRGILSHYSTEVIPQYDRIFVRVKEEKDYQGVKERLQKVFGIVSLSPVETASLSIESIQEQALRLITRDRKPPFTFKVETRRPNKSFSLTSPEVNRQVGTFILDNTNENVTVDVHSPEVELKIEIRSQEAYLYATSYPGLGGLPVGVSGKGMLLLSGGIDSPVAGWMCMKRGMTLEAIHFHSYPFTSERSKEKVKELARVLSSYGGHVVLHVMPFTEIQKEIQNHCPRDLTITIMRRMMFRLARDLAETRSAGALITGENLGQVASQTLENITLAEEKVDRPVFRPLIGLDKQEIINLAEFIETYPVSIQPYEDCCTVFLPQHPDTKPSLRKVQIAEENLDAQQLLSRCINERETINFKYGK